MYNILIVSPHFPPINAPDMHRIRISLRYFSEFGWNPIVLSVAPQYTEWEQDSLLLKTIPKDIPVYRTNAFPPQLTRRFGVSSISIRAFPFLYKNGAQIIKKHKIDLVYFSTTMFMLMPIGRIWKKKFGIPFVIDIQDPWVNDVPNPYLKKRYPVKYPLSRLVDRLLESWTMRAVDGIIAVSEPYHKTLRRRYPWIRPEVCRTIPFGGSSVDFEIAAKSRLRNPYFDKNDHLVHGVYVGVLGVMKDSCLAICLAFKKGLEMYPSIFEKVRLHFIGTDYDIGTRAKGTIAPIARDLGLSDYILEDPRRVPYFLTLKILKEADFLLIPGSPNPDYTASKIYPYILSHKPILAIFHEKSSVVDILRSTRAGNVVSFSSKTTPYQVAKSLLPVWQKFLEKLPFQPSVNWEAFKPYTARETTKKQCELFDKIIKNYTKG